MIRIPSECADYANSNPDIGGVGVRISFYLQTFILVLLVDRSWPDAPVALWTFIATSFGLTIAAIAVREQLTLFQALQVSNLVWLANFGTFVALASYSRQKAASPKKLGGRRSFDYNVKFGAMAQTLLSMALTLYMWYATVHSGTTRIPHHDRTNAKTFGSQPDCSSFVKYMLFVIEVPALGAGRSLGLVVTSILTAAYSVITLLEVWSYCRRDADNGKAGRSEILPTHLPANLSPSISLSLQSPSPTNIARPQDSNLHIRYDQQPAVSPALELTYPPKLFHKRRPRRRRWSSDLDPMLVGIIICQAMVFTYFIVSTELLLKNNPSLDHSAAQWRFGQILALIVVIPSALSLTGAIMKRGVRRPSQRTKEHFAKESSVKGRHQRGREEKTLM